MAGEPAVQAELGVVVAVLAPEEAGVAVRACGNRGVAQAPEGQVVEAEPVPVGWVAEVEQAVVVELAVGVDPERGAVAAVDSAAAVVLLVEGLVAEA